MLLGVFHSLSFFFLMIRRPPRSPLFPPTTLSRPRPLRPPGRARPAGRGVAPPHPPPPGRTGRGARLSRLRGLGARVRALPRLLRGGAEERLHEIGRAHV